MLSRRGALLLAAGAVAQLSWPVGGGDATSAASAGPAAGEPSARPGIEALLAARARALLSGVAQAGDAEQEDLRARLAQVPFTELSYRLTGFAEPAARPAVGSRLVATADLGYRLRGADDYPAVQNRRLTFTRRAADWQVAVDEPTGAAALWDLGTVRAAQGAHCLVLGLGDPAGLAPVAAAADHAVPAVNALWGTGWAGRLVIEIPGTEEQFARLLDVPAGDYQGIAAVTTAAAGAPYHAPADRVLLNPDAFAGLSELGRRVVTTHEATHVATRADTRTWTPLWLSEGVADYTGYRDTGRTARQIAPELARDVAAGRIPTALPADADFTAGSAGIAQAYELAWTACHLIAHRYGEPQLVALYRAVGAADPGQAREEWLDRQFRAQLGLGISEFTKTWIGEVRSALGP